MSAKMDGRTRSAAKPKRSREVTTAFAAKQSFEGMGVLEMPDRSKFMECAGNAYTTLATAALMLRLSSAEMADAFRKVTEKEQDDGLAALDGIRVFTETRRWFEAYAKTLAVIEARGFIALSQVAVAP